MDTSKHYWWPDKGVLLAADVPFMVLLSARTCDIRHMASSNVWNTGSVRILLGVLDGPWADASTTGHAQGRISISQPLISMSQPVISMSQHVISMSQHALWFWKHQSTFHRSNFLWNYFRALKDWEHLFGGLVVQTFHRYWRIFHTLMAPEKTSKSCW